MDIVSVPGRLVRDPVTRRVVDQTPISIDPSSPYWVRLLADGDVAEAPKSEAAPADKSNVEPDHVPESEENPA